MVKNMFHASDFRGRVVSDVVSYQQLMILPTTMNNAFVINLDDRQEQFLEVKHAFSSYGITCERFSAMRHQHGFIGCAWSHLQLIALAKKNEWPWVMVLEDDCVPRESMKEWSAIKKFLIQEVGRWDLFLGGSIGAIPEKLQKILSATVSLIECRRAITAHFVIYNKTSYDQLLAWHELPMAMEKRPAFDVFINQCSLKKWISQPGIAWQKPHESAILKKFIDYRSFFETSEQVLERFVTTQHP